MIDLKLTIGTLNAKTVVVISVLQLAQYKQCVKHIKVKNSASIRNYQLPSMKNTSYFDICYYFEFGNITPLDELLGASKGVFVYSSTEIPIKYNLR